MSRPLNELATHHVTQVGAAVALNRWLASLCGLLALVVVAQAVMNVRTASIVENFKPLVVGLDTKGRPVVTSYDDAVWKKDADAVRVYLANFFELHYRLVRRTIAADWAHSLYFLDQAVSKAEEDRNLRDQIVERFQNDATQDEVEVTVQNVALDEFTTAPFRATVEFEKVFLVAGQGRERKRESWTAKVQFGLLEQTPNWMLKVNLPGLLITKLDVFPAFSNE